MKRTVDELGGLDILVNNAGEQHSDKDIRDITEDQLKRTFQTNIFGMFYLTQAAHAASQGRGRRSSIARRKRCTRARKSCSITARPRAQSRRSPDRSPRIWSKKGIRVNGGCAGPDLDSAQPVRRHGSGQDRRVREGHADGSAGTAQRSRAVIPVSGLRRFQLHDRPGAPSRRRRHDFELTEPLLLIVRRTFDIEL